MTDRALAKTDAIDLTAIESELVGLSADKLKLEFFQCYNGAASLIARAAVCVKLLERQGERLTGMPMVGTFRRIADGQILPELAWKFLESPNRQRVERLPLSDQKRLAVNPMVPVAEGPTERLVDLTQAPPELAKVILGPDGIRSPEEQRAYQGAMRARAAVAKPPANLPVSEPLNRKLTVSFTTPEFAALMENAASEGVSDCDYVRRVLHRAGALRRNKG